MAIFDKVDKKGYIWFKKYYGNMFKEFKDVSKFTLQINYQKFYDVCTSEEKEIFDKL